MEMKTVYASNVLTAFCQWRHQSTIFVTRPITLKVSFLICTMYRDSVSRKKRDQNVFLNIYSETPAILIKFGTQFPE